MSAPRDEAADSRNDRVQAILHEYLLALDAGRAPDRHEILRRHPELAEELQALFADQDQLNRLLQSLRAAPPAGVPEPPTLAPEEPATPDGPLATVRFFGDYELLAEIARGGMGVVYKARQVSLNRIAALKMILAGQLASAADVQRFRTEAEAAAHLDHPQIVPIYEVGEHQGQHYFSMKYIDGGSLADEVPELVDDPKAAARLLALVARAVHHAHQRGILHRDLKPGNILLDAAGQPHVTDFGLAKRVEGDSGQTRTGVIVGTPSYMAPEQARADKALTTAADVYALGAILYELLTGQPPFRAATPLDTVLLVRDREPVPPRSLNARAARDLETISSKCLAKDPAQRYESAAALADDLDRFVAGAPIRARPVGPWERGVKWVRRRPAVAALLAVIVGLALVSFAVVLALWQRAEEARREAVARKEEAERHAAHAQEQRARAEASYQLAREALDEWLKVKDDPRLQQGPLEDLRKQLLVAQAAFYQKFLRQRGADADFQSDRANALFNLGVITWELGSRDEAVRQMEQARTIYEHLATEAPQQLRHQANLASSYGNLGLFYTDLGQFPDAEATLRRAQEISEGLVQQQPTNPERQDGLAHAYTNLADLYRKTGRPDQAASAFRQALRLREELARQSPEELSYQHLLGHAWHNLGVMNAQTNQLADAETAYGKAQVLFAQHAKDHPEIAAYQADLARCGNNTASLYLQLGRRAQAEAAYRQALELRERLARDHPAVSSYQEDLAESYFNLGNLNSTAGRRDEAKGVYAKALELFRQLAARHPTDLSLAVVLGRAQAGLGDLELGFTPGVQLNSLARVLGGRGNAPEAIRWYDQAIATLTGVRHRQLDHPQARQYLCHCYSRRSVARTNLELYVEALEDLDRAIELADDAYRKVLEFSRGAARFLADQPEKRLKYADRLAHQGQHARAAAEAETAARLKSLLSSVGPYDVACVYALCTAAARRDLALAADEREKLAGRYAAQALAYLAKAKAAGYFGSAGRIEWLKKDSDLEALRAHPDFQRFLKELESAIKP